MNPTTNVISLFGPLSPPLVSVGDTLRSLGCVVTSADAPTDLPAGAVLAVLEFRPEETDIPGFRELSAPLGDFPTVVIGPDLSGPGVARLLAGRPAHTYLRLGTPLPERREALRVRLPLTGEPDLQVGPLRLSLREGAVWYRAQPVTVTGAEFRLLSWLMRSPGEWIDGPTLAALAQCRSVAAHLSSVRRKLGQCGGASLLRARPGRGYAIDARGQPRHSPNAAFALTQHLRHLS